MREEVQRLQAVLFARGESVSWKELSETLGATEEKVRQWVVELQDELQGTALTVAVSGTEGVQLAVIQDLADQLGNNDEDETSDALSRAAAETLAVVAYKGPLSQQEVALIRGVDSRAMLRQLVRRGILSRQKQKNAVVLYDVTLDAWREMGVSRREELPDYEALAHDEKLETFLQNLG